MYNLILKSANNNKSSRERGKRKGCIVDRISPAGWSFAIFIWSVLTHFWGTILEAIIPLYKDLVYVKLMRKKVPKAKEKKGQKLKEKAILVARSSKFSRISF